MTQPASLHLRIPATTDAFLGALPEIHAFAEAQSLTQPERYALDVALEEYVTNLIRHGHPDPDPSAPDPPAPEAPDDVAQDTPPAPEETPGGQVPSGVSGIEVAIRISVDAQTLSLFLEDTGHPFDPTRRPPPSHLTDPLEERPIGGLGIHLMRNLFHEIDYQYTQGRNHLELRLHRSGKSPP